MILGPLYKEGAVCAPRRLGDFFEPILFFLCQKEKNGFNLPRKERGPMRTVVLNLTQKISAISCPSRSSLPPERSLRSAHRLSAELLTTSHSSCLSAIIKIACGA